MEIRELTEADTTPYLALRLRALRDHPDAFGASYDEEAAHPIEHTVERLRAAAASPDDFILGAFDDGILVGMVGFRRATYAKVRHQGFIWGMYTTHEVRGRGIGRALLAEAIRRARAIPGVEQINLSVVAHNPAARTLYLSVGFEVYGLERRALKLPDGTYLDEEHMALWLDPETVQ